MLSAEFILTSLVVVLMPGTGVIYTVSTGLFRGRRASVAAAAGCTAGIVPHMLASILGLSAILHMSALAFQAVKTAGAIYLLYLAWGMWRDTGVLRFDADKTRQGTARIMIRGFLINILNPKLSIFFLSFLPLFVPPDVAEPLPQMLMLSGVFMAMTLGIFIAYGICAGSVRGYMANSPGIMRKLQRSFALVFAALGTKLVFTRP